jgi:hypothetical protein
MVKILIAIGVVILVLGLSELLIDADKEGKDSEPDPKQ